MCEVPRDSHIPRDLHVSKDPPRARDHGERNTIKEHATHDDLSNRIWWRTASTNMGNNLFVELPTARLD